MEVEVSSPHVYSHLLYVSIILLDITFILICLSLLILLLSLLSQSTIDSSSSCWPTGDVGQWCCWIRGVIRQKGQMVLMGPEKHLRPEELLIQAPCRAVKLLGPGNILLTGSCWLLKVTYLSYLNFTLKSHTYAFCWYIQRKIMFARPATSLYSPWCRCNSATPAPPM